jgi:trehalose 6-phosphate synthase
MNDSSRNKARRMKAMRRQVFENDIDRWASTFLEDLEGLNGKPSTQAAG